MESLNSTSNRRNFSDFEFINNPEQSDDDVISIGSNVSADSSTQIQSLNGEIKKLKEDNSALNRKLNEVFNSLMKEIQGLKQERLASDQEKYNLRQENQRLNERVYVLEQENGRLNLPQVVEQTTPTPQKKGSILGTVKSVIDFIAKNSDFEDRSTNDFYFGGHDEYRPHYVCIR